jgi:DNA-binding MarR family transcriptional regulator/GNAT superfamily N-acetyltransferase
MARTDVDQRVEAVRHFNRFYTGKIGVLDEGLLDSVLSLTAVRILYELAHRDRPTAAELVRDLDLDPGYLSRLLRGFQKRGWITRQSSAADGRQRLLALTPKGSQVFAPLDARARRDVGAMLHGLAEIDQDRLVGAMQRIERLLGDKAERATQYLLRSHRPGDLGWVVHRHGVLYAQEYGWDERFEGLVAGIVAKFVEAFDPRREHCWIAECEGEPVGSVFLVNQSPRVAKLRLLLVEPAARGMGIGRRLVEECIRFARQAEYRTISLWTNEVLRAARHIYQATGFRLVRKEPHQSFGKTLVAETWELVL